jgi:hypothetical protein
VPRDLWLAFVAVLLRAISASRLLRVEPDPDEHGEPGQAQRNADRDRAPLSTIRGADRILVLDGGRVVQHGTYAELAGRKGPVRRPRAQTAGVA